VLPQFVFRCQQTSVNQRYGKTRQGEVFVRDALQNEKKVGSIEITLIQPVLVKS
jgi:hypothetical protein